MTAAVSDRNANGAIAIAIVPNLTQPLLPVQPYECTCACVLHMRVRARVRLPV